MKKTVLKTSLDHLPFNHQQDLAFIKDTILKYLPAEMIILFGSYAIFKGRATDDKIPSSPVSTMMGR